MKDVFLILGILILAMGLRASRTAVVRKTGAVCLLAASFLIFYLPSDHLLIGACGVLVWLFLPWFELLTRVRSMRLPVDNRLKCRLIPNPSLFPNANEASAAMEEAGFDHVSDCGWEWAGMRQFFRLYWHPEERAVAAVALCEQAHVAFSFISITSHDANGTVWRTTNFPFAHTLSQPPHIHWHHVSCCESCFHHILKEHREYLKRSEVSVSSLCVPNPEEIEHHIEDELRRQVRHNLGKGLIQLTQDGHFRYSIRGLLFLWLQFLKDMVKYC